MASPTGRGGCAARFRDLRRCMRTIRSFTNGQASIADFKADPRADSDLGEEAVELCRVYFDITPNEGPYKDMTFLFKVELPSEYPCTPPQVTCLTTIYHPNIDPTSPEQNVCLNLLDYAEWTSCNFGLEDVVQGLLFLLYNPNHDDPGSPYFDDYTPDDWEEDTAKAMLGEMTEYFDPNSPCTELVEESDKVTTKDEGTITTEVEELLEKMQSLEKYEEQAKGDCPEPSPIGAQDPGEANDQTYHVQDGDSGINDLNSTDHIISPTLSRQASKSEPRLTHEDLLFDARDMNGNNISQSDVPLRHTGGLLHVLLVFPEFNYLLMALGSAVVNICSVR